MLVCTTLIAQFLREIVLCDDSTLKSPFLRNEKHNACQHHEAKSGITARAAADTMIRAAFGELNHSADVRVSAHVLVVVRDDYAVY